jgi:putative tryptophan/tyrosine transport system substrate-binding protein
MRRIGLAIVLTLALLALGAPLATEAQAPPKEPRVGYLSIGSASDPRRVAIYEAFRQSLRDRGYIENRNISIERRFAEGNYDRLPGLAAELVRRRVDVIAAYSTPAAKAALGATKSIPIVMSGVVDPVATGLVVGLARPGGNVTGLSLMAPEIVGKQMQLLKELIPSVSRIAVLWNPANPSGAPQLQEAEVAARALKVQLQPLEARKGDDLDRVLATMTRARADGMVVVVDGVFIDSRIRLARLAEKARLPAVYGLREHVEVGGLMFYGASPVDQARRAATLVDKILKGAKPGDLPVEQPTEFELVINLKTARALRLSVPQSVLVRADEMIQ